MKELDKHFIVIILLASVTSFLDSIEDGRGQCRTEVVSGNCQNYHKGAASKQLTGIERGRVC